MGKRRAEVWSVGQGFACVWVSCVKPNEWMRMQGKAHPGRNVESITETFRQPIRRLVTCHDGYTRRHSRCVNQVCSGTFRPSLRIDASICHIWLIPNKSRQHILRWQPSMKCVCTSRKRSGGIIVAFPGWRNCVTSNKTVYMFHEITWLV